MTHSPKLTVLMCVFNGEKYLQTAIDSVLAQSFRDFEFIIVNDGSTDSSRDIILGCHDPRIRLIDIEANLGLTAALNRGLASASGEYLARMDADDICLGERFQKQVAFLDAHPEVGVLGSGCVLVDQAGRPGRIVLFSEHHSLIFWYLCFQNPIIHPSVMLRTACLKQAGGYRTLFNHSEDYDLWWRLITLVRFSNLQEPLIQLRSHAQSITQQNTATQKMLSYKIWQEMAPRVFGRLNGLDMDIFGCPEKVNQQILASYIETMAALFLQMNQLSPAEKSSIRLDAAKRLLIVALSRPFKFGSWRITARALRLNFTAVFALPLEFIKASLKLPVVNPIFR